MVILLENLGDLDWGNHWDKKLKLREVPLRGYHEGMVMENLRDNEWEKHW